MPRKDYRIHVRGKQRDEIDIALFVQALLAIAEQEAVEAGDEQLRQVDAGGVAIEEPPNLIATSEE